MRDDEGRSSNISALLPLLGLTSSMRVGIRGDSIWRELWLLGDADLAPKMSWTSVVSI